MNNGLANEWNEQQEYSEFYFKISMACREYQSQNKLQNWYHSLEAKVSFIISVVDEKTMLNVKEARLVVQRLYADYLTAKDRINKRNGITTEYKEATYILKEALFEFECDLDRELNKVMPFLNLQEKQGVSSW